MCGVYWLISVNGSLTPWFRWIYWFWQPSQSLNPIKPDPDNFLILPLIPRLTFKTHESFMLIPLMLHCCTLLYSWLGMKIMTILIFIGVQTPCIMCGRPHFLIQKYSISCKHLATKVQSSTPTNCLPHIPQQPIATLLEVLLH